jgi:phage/plasmid-like protein (TIGR03299 family)
MSAEFTTGFAVRQASWHGQETLLAEAPADWDEFRMAAGLMWEPKAVPVYTRTLIPAGLDVPEGAVVIAAGPEGTDCMVEVPDHKASVRDDTGAVLGVPTKQWTEITHAQMGELIEAFRKADRGFSYETGGVLAGGKRVYGVAKLDEPFRVGRDETEHYPYFAILNDHSGGGACRVLPLSFRVVCANTYRMAEAHGDRTGTQVVIRHVGDVASRIEEAKAAIAAARFEASAYREMADHLAGINVDDALVATFFDRFIPPAPENASERTLADRAERRALIQAIHDESPTVDGVRGTAFGLVAVATEYLDHIRPYRSQDSYLARTLLGRDDRIKGNAVKLVRELVGSAN